MKGGKVRHSIMGRVVYLTNPVYLFLLGNKEQWGLSGRMLVILGDAKATISYKVYQDACAKAGYCIDSLFAVRGPKSCLRG